MKKKLSIKVPKVQLPSKKAAEAQKSERITNDTIEAHRQQVLAGGRKFKYPVQYARHRLVINTVIIAVITVIVLTLIAWWQLYGAQNTSGFMYRVTRVVPVPVASVDGTMVRYSDYLLRYRGSAQYLIERSGVDSTTDDGQTQLEYAKRQELNAAISAAYAQELAEQYDVTVDDADFEAFLASARKADCDNCSETTYAGVVLDFFGWSQDEYREVMRSRLLLQEVKYAVDDEAKDLSSQVQKQLKDGVSLEEISAAINKENEGAVTYAAPVWVPNDNQDGGLAAAALKLKDGEVSGPIQPTTGQGYQAEGYYFVKRISADDNRVQYEYIGIPLTEFTNKIEKLRKDEKIKEFIEVDEVKS